ncbi:ribosome biogenesis GTP-binding protein YihA/YsxC [Nannocystis sp. SCPEA4]|uniref:ribosome biogenesis GTP-binding protein YihA/YsxC n=1 Tax=Nannocystis sp. SCPEA4 TaxID=2996787 RepID=UPI002271DD3D|nr:ribosome biogenesis GTP-binding protein YihA/YsxC [Nannocystis sp. SCPEA4]MCY1062329.1 ribosome biogenesis GTP-binding protein YihA/YsxC [Nannocystis sp. SCPEA4]
MAAPSKTERNSPGGWRVASASFERSADKLGAAPPGDLPEIAVTGRSNVGKSSLLNAFAGQRALARVSSTPGRTQLLNFFRATLRHPRHGDLGLRWVDLPGYGYAAAPQAVRASFGPMIEGYLRKREALKGLVLLIDARREVSEYDHALLDFMADRALWTIVAVTKADKLSKGERGMVTAGIARALQLPRGQVLVTSATSGLGFSDGGLAEALARRLRAETAEGAEEAPGGSDLTEET